MGVLVGFHGFFCPFWWVFMVFLDVFGGFSWVFGLVYRRFFQFTNYGFLLVRR